MVSAPTVLLHFNLNYPTADGLSPRVMFADYFPEAACMMLKISLWLSCVIVSGVILHTISVKETFHRCCLWAELTLYFHFYAVIVTLKDTKRY